MFLESYRDIWSELGLSTFEIDKQLTDMDREHEVFLPFV